MTSAVDYSVHEVDGPSEIPRHTPLSDQRKRAPGKKRRRRKKTGGAGEADLDTDPPNSGDSTPQNRDDHEVDFYA